MTGESGSGKTEASKLVLQYLTGVTGHHISFHNIKFKLLQSNPILEGTLFTFDTFNSNLDYFQLLEMLVQIQMTTLHVL